MKKLLSHATLCLTIAPATSFELVDTFFLQHNVNYLSSSSNGDFLVATEARNPNGQNPLFVLRLTSEGEISWETRVDGTALTTPEKVDSSFRSFSGKIFLSDTGASLVPLSGQSEDNMVAITPDGSSDRQWGSSGSTFFAGSRENNSWTNGPRDAQLLGYLKDASFLTFERIGLTRDSTWGYIVKYAPNGGRDDSFRPFRSYFDQQDSAEYDDRLGFSKELRSGKIIFISNGGDIFLCSRSGIPIDTFGEGGITRASRFTSLPRTNNETTDVIELSDGTLRFAAGVGPNTLALYDIDQFGNLDRSRLSNRVQLITTEQSVSETHFLENGLLAARAGGKVIFIDQVGDLTTAIDTELQGPRNRLTSNKDHLFLIEGAKVKKFLFPVDSDGDQLSDELENKLGTSSELIDSDADGIDDWTEVLGLNLNPLNPDTDEDGYGDGLEYSNGFDPLDPTSKPSELIEIRPAVEISVFGEAGKSYRLEYSEDLENWTDSGIVFEGTGSRFDHLASTRTTNHKHWRVVEIEN